MERAYEHIPNLDILSNELIDGQSSNPSKVNLGKRGHKESIATDEIAEELKDQVE
jgi:hypothetical protein